MRDTAFEPHARIKSTYAELDRFERQAATLLGSTVVFAVVVSLVLFVAIL